MTLYRRQWSRPSQEKEMQKAKWLCICVSPFLGFPPIEVTTEHQVESPVVYSRCSWVTYFVPSINSVHVNPSLPVHPTPHSSFPLLVSTCLFSASVTLFLRCKWFHLYHFSRFHIHLLIYNICFLFLIYFTLYRQSIQTALAAQY